MAQNKFKVWILKYTPEAAERSTYILVSGLTSIILIGLWLEDRDLAVQHGDDCRAYQKETGKVLPKFFK